MMGVVCQWIVAGAVVANLFSMLRTAFHGRSARDPGGFPGAVVSILLTALLALLYWGAGAFDRILP